MKRNRRGTTLVVGLALVATACTGGEAGLTTATEESGPATTTTTSAATTTTASRQTRTRASETTVGSGIRPAAGGFATGLEYPTFGITLVVLEEESDIIDQAVLVGAPDGENVDPGCLVFLTDVPVTGGTFTLEFPDVSVEGEFVTPERVEGEVRGLTSDAQSCGFPETLMWAADCNQTVMVEGDRFSTESGVCGVVGD